MRTAIAVVSVLALAFGLWFAYLHFQKEFDPFEGEWTVIYSEQDGDIVPQDDLNGMKLKFSGDDIYVHENGETKKRFVYAADKSLIDGPVDFLALESEKKHEGRFRFMGNKLLLVIQKDNNQPRPKDFETSKGSGRWKVSLERIR